MITKFSREIRSSPRTAKKRVYKNFESDKFLTDIREIKASGGFDVLYTAEDFDEAVEIFTNIFNKILDKHAPLKIIQNRNNYIPHIKKETKEMMEKRNTMKEKAASTGKFEDHEEYKSIRNRVTSLLRGSEKNYYENKFSDPEATSSEI